MKINLDVNIEKDGIQHHVGYIEGNAPEDARFYYAKEYLKKADARPVSISLPLQEETFSTNVLMNSVKNLLMHWRPLSGNYPISDSNALK